MEMENDPSPTDHAQAVSPTDHLQVANHQARDQKPEDVEEKRLVNILTQDD